MAAQGNYANDDAKQQTLTFAWTTNGLYPTISVDRGNPIGGLACHTWAACQITLGVFPISTGSLGHNPYMYNVICTW